VRLKRFVFSHARRPTRLKNPKAQRPCRWAFKVLGFVLPWIEKIKNPDDQPLRLGALEARGAPGVI